MTSITAVTVTTAPPGSTGRRSGTAVARGASRSSSTSERSELSGATGAGSGSSLGRGRGQRTTHSGSRRIAPASLSSRAAGGGHYSTNGPSCFARAFCRKRTLARNSSATRKFHLGWHGASVLGSVSPWRPSEMMHDLIGGYERVRRVYKLYIESAFPLRSDTLTHERAELLGAASQAGTLAQPPLLETVPVYQRTPLTLSQA